MKLDLWPMHSIFLSPESSCTPPSSCPYNMPAWLYFSFQFSSLHFGSHSNYFCSYFFHRCGVNGQNTWNLQVDVLSKTHDFPPSLDSSCLSSSDKGGTKRVAQCMTEFCLASSCTVIVSVAKAVMSTIALSCSENSISCNLHHFPHVTYFLPLL